jgi:hypothetical protein
MTVPVETLVDGAVRTLLDAVVPAVGTRYARGQLYAVIDVLRNLRDRIEERQSIADADAAGAADALEKIVAALRTAGASGAADAVASAAAPAPDGPPGPRAAALAAALVRASEVLSGLPPERVAGARAVLEGHYVDRALRSVSMLKPSLLAEISQA